MISNIKVQKSNILFKKRLYNLVLRTLKFLEKLPRNSTTKVVVNQLTRSITSICANYIEARSASSRRDYINYFQISLKSANESKFWLALLKDSGNAPESPTDEILDELAQICKILGSSIVTLKK